MAERFGLESLGFLTLTTERGEHWKEFQRRYDNARRRVVNELFQANMTVFEFSQGARLHAHSLVSARMDIRTGFDFSKYLMSIDKDTPLQEKRRLIREAAAHCTNLRNAWAELRERLPRYGFGRHELIPVRSNADAIAYYLGKYIGKSVPNRTKEMKGCRFVRYSQGWRTWKVSFSWATPGGWLWRRKAQMLEDALTELLRPAYGEGYKARLREIFGRRWAYHLQDIIQALDVCAYPTLEHAVAAGVAESDLAEIPPYAEDISNVHSLNALPADMCAKVALHVKSQLRYGGKFRDIAREALSAVS